MWIENNTCNPLDVRHQDATFPARRSVGNVACLWPETNHQVGMNGWRLDRASGAHLIRRKGRGAASDMLQMKMGESASLDMPKGTVRVRKAA